MSAEQYSQDALDETRSEMAREAAMLYSIAETQLAENDFAEAARAAKEALSLFRELGDRKGVADSLHVLVGVHRVKEELELADALVADELERFRECDNVYGEGAMQLAFAEVNFARRNEEAVRSGAEALQIFKELQDEKMQAGSHLALMSAYHAQGQSKAKEALEAATAALELYRGASDKKGEGKALHGLALAYSVAEKWSDALKYARNARSIFQEMSMPKLEAAELCECARLNEKLKDFKAMEQDAQESMELYQSCDGQQGEAEAMVLLVRALTAQGDEDAATQAAETGLMRFKDMDYRKGQAAAMECIVNHLVSKGDAEQALPMAQETLEIHQESNDLIGQATMLYAISDMQLADKHYDDAKQSAQTATSLMKQAGDMRGEAEVLLNILATVYAGLSQWSEALNSASEAQELYQKIGDAKGEGMALFVYGTIYQMINVFDQAELWTREAHKIFQELGETRLLVEVLHALANIMVKTERFDEATKLGSEGQQLSQKDKDKALEVQMTLFMVQVYFAILNKWAEKEGANRGSREFTDPFNKAEKNAISAMKATEKLENPSLRASALYSLSEVNLVAGKFREAENQATEGEKIFADVGSRLGEGSCCAVKAQALIYTNRFQDGLTAADKAFEIAQEIGDKQLEDQAARLQERVRGSTMMQQPMLMQQPVMQVQEAAPEVSSAIVEEKPKGLDPLMVGDMLHGMLREMVGVQMESDTPFMDAGVDSLMSIEFRSQVNQAFAGLSLASTLTFDYPTIRELTGHIVDKSLA